MVRVAASRGLAGAAGEEGRGGGGGGRERWQDQAGFVSRRR